MSDHLQIVLSRSTPKVKSKIFQLLHRQSANLTHNAEDDLYYVDMKIVSHSREILDQIAESLTQTVQYIPGKPHQYSFSRVLDPLEIYDNNIKPNTKLDYQHLEEQLANVIDDSFTTIKKSISTKYIKLYQQEAPQNPQTTKITEPPTSKQMKQFIQQKLSNLRHSSLDFQIIDEESGEDDQNDNSESLLGLSRIMPKKMSLETSSSKSMINYFRRLVKGQRDEK